MICIGFYCLSGCIGPNLSILIDHEVILDDVILPDLNDFLEESLCVMSLSRKLEQMAHVEVALAEVDALWAMLDALLIDACS